MSTYKDAVNALNNLQSNPETYRKQVESGDFFSTQRSKVPNMVKLINRCGLKMEAIDQLPVVHVSGTKGKGSTCAYLERIFHHHGYKTGFYSSPHLVEVRERFRINGRPMDKETFSKYFWTVYNRLKETEDSYPLKDGGGMPPYSSFLTILSFHVFVSEGVDVFVLETGIGGQYDNTNVLRHPVVCGVTSLGFDHMSSLGSTIQDIAWHKAGIFKPNHPAITVCQKPEAMKVILDRAKEKQSPLYISKSMSASEMEKHHISLGIAGERQVDNASLAIHLYNIFLRERTSKNGEGQDVNSQCEIEGVEDIPQLVVDDIDDATVKALRDCVWPGRAQTLKKEGITYYLDGAHIEESMTVCSNWFKDAADLERKSTKEKTARVLIYSVTKNRPQEPLLSLLKTADFDVAVFCTTLLSTMESANKTDVLNKNFNQSSLLQWAEGAKVYWDSHCHPKLCSQLFPCIMDALCWVTQARDPQVVALGRTGMLPEVPRILLEADRLQVFVGGNLYIVGGVLGVIDPHMND